MKNTINPYELSTEQSSHPVLNKKAAFLVLAVPASFVIYGEACLSLTHPFDPVTFARTKLTLTNAHRLTACVDAFLTAAGYIVLPWSFVACDVHINVDIPEKKE